MPKNKKIVTLALQGGGSHGAFTWGVIDKLLEDGRLEIEGISATSAGSMNACVYAYGFLRGGTTSAREMLKVFWQKISVMDSFYNPLKSSIWEQWIHGNDISQSFNYNFFQSMTNLISPYQLNPFNFNPLRQVLEEVVDFDELAQSHLTKLFLSATNVRTGKVHVFPNEDVNADVVMASACLPFLFKAIIINGEAYWDGGYTGNPVLFPLVKHIKHRDVIIIHVNPIIRNKIPMEANEILDRINEISFNASLLKELRAFGLIELFVKRGWVKKEYIKRINPLRFHSIRADDFLSHLNLASKYNASWSFLEELYHIGYKAADLWLEKHFDDIGKQSTLEI